MKTIEGRITVGAPHSDMRYKEAHRICADCLSSPGATILRKKGDTMVLPTNLEAIHEAYNVFKLTDSIWQNWLEYTFGKQAGDMRYRPEGKEHPNCKAAYEQFVKARDNWFKLTYEGRKTVS